MEVLYKSTRGAEEAVTASCAILKGLAKDGGLFVPTEIPKLSLSMEELSKMSYQETAYEVMKLFLTDFTEEELKACIAGAYDKKFDTDVIAPLAKVEGAYYLELFHGATIAFKDMALSILPYLMTTAAKKNHIKNEIVILTATSGDTGKAALAGFADVPGTKIIVFYPKNGVSPIQEKQMVTQAGDNTMVVGIHGNFDDAQSGVKAIFGNKELAEELDKAGYQFSSANSINIGRLVPQVVYYVYAYAINDVDTAFSKTEGVSVTISGGLNVGIPNVVGDDSSLGVNVSVQQQTNKSWTYGTSDSKTVTKTRTGQIPIQPGETVKLDAVLVMYKGSLTYVATLRKIGDTKTFRVKGKWSGDCFSSFEARTYNPTTGKLVGEYVLE